MDRTSFTAVIVTSGSLHDVDVHVGWAADEVGNGPHLILMRDRGEEEYCVVSGDSDTYATHHGGVTGVDVSEDGTALSFDASAAVELELPTGTITITHRPGDVAELRARVAEVLGGQVLIAAQDEARG